MSNQENHSQPATKADIDNLKVNIDNLALNLPKAVKTIVQEEFHEVHTELGLWKDEILTSNDGVSKETKVMREEQAAIHGNYKKMDGKLDQILVEQKSITDNNKKLGQKVENLEDFTEAKFGAEFQRT